MRHMRKSYLETQDVSYILNIGPLRPAQRPHNAAAAAIMSQVFLKQT